MGEKILNWQYLGQGGNSVAYKLSDNVGNTVCFKHVRTAIQQIGSGHGIIDEVAILNEANKAGVKDVPQLYMANIFGSKPSSQNQVEGAWQLVEFIDKNYRTIATKKGRAITGYSMGGHGALLICFKHQQTFGACGSMAGTLDLRMKVNDEKIKVLGEYAKYRSAWDDNSVVELLYLLNRVRMPAIIIDCGTEDHLLCENEKVHQKMLDMRMPHDYITRPGKHNGKYWGNAIDTQILFFLKFFAEGNAR